MKILSIDTSSSTCSVAVTIGKRIAGEMLIETDRTLTNRLLSCIDSILDGAGLAIDAVDCLAVALGPGSFTGVRVGVATAKGLALATGKPVVGFSSLAMLAASLPHAGYPVCPMMDARKNEVYAAIYHCAPLPEALSEDCVLTPAEFLRKLKGPTIFVGEGASKYRDIISSAMGADAIFAPWYLHQSRASAGAALAMDLFRQGRTIPLAHLSPFYIRPSEAELSKKPAPSPKIKNLPSHP